MKTTASITPQTIIATRDFVRQFSSIGKKPKSKQYMIVNHGKPIGVFIPYEAQPNDEWWKPYASEIPAEKPKKRMTLKDLEKYRFHSGEKHLSQRIDEIVYGIKR